MKTALIAWHLLRKTVSEFLADKATRLAAALAFFTALSLAPLLLIVISLAGMAFGEEAARGKLTGQLQDMVGPKGAEAVNSMLAGSQPKDGGWLAGLIGLGVLVFAATGVFAQLQDSLNTVWKVDPEKAAGGIWGMVRDRLLSLSMVCGMAFLLLVSFVLSTVLHAVNGAMGRWLPGMEVAIGWGNFALSLFLTFAMFAMIYKVLPHTKLAWSDVWIGAGLTTALFEVGRFVIGLYIGKAAPESSFGAAGSFVALLFWLYYSSVILMFGAEFTYVYATERGSITDLRKANAGATEEKSAGPPLAFGATHV